MAEAGTGGSGQRCATSTNFKIVLVRSAVLAIAELLVGFTMWKDRLRSPISLFASASGNISQVIGPCGTFK